MEDWKMIPEIIGCNASLRMAAMQAVDAVEQGRHFIIEGEAGTGRRLLARSAWCRRSPGSRSLFTVDCRMFRHEGAESILFGERPATNPQNTIPVGKLNVAVGGGLLLLHVEFLHLKTQARIAKSLEQYLCIPRNEGIQLVLTHTPSLDESLHPDLSEMLLRVRVPALRERVEDIRAIAEAFLRNASPFDRIRCSQALIDRFCGYDWPGNITELRSVLRRLLLEAHNGLLDVRHLADVMCRDATLLHGEHLPVSQLLSGLIPLDSMADNRSMQ